MEDLPSSEMSAAARFLMFLLWTENIELFVLDGRARAAEVVGWAARRDVKLEVKARFEEEEISFPWVLFGRGIP